MSKLNRILAMLYKVIFSFIFAFLGFPLLVFSLSENNTYKEEKAYKEDEVLVKFKSQMVKEIQNLSKEEKERKILDHLRRANLEILKTREVGKNFGPIWVIKFDKKVHKLEEVIEKLKKHPDVEYVEPNYKRRINSLPNDYQSSYWWVDKIKLPQAWDITIGSEEVVVAVVDTGVDYTHEDLWGNMWRNPFEIPGNGIDDDGNGYVDDIYGINAILDDGDPMDDDGHGTHVAGIIGAIGNNGVGVVGVNWRVKILACKFIGSNGEGYLSDELSCLDYIVKMKDKGINIKVINMSFGSYAYSNIEYQLLKALNDRGIILIPAAGNDRVNNDITPHYPCNYNLENMICVAASDSYDNLASFSNYGNNSVHLAAPGVNIYSTYIYDKDNFLQNINNFQTIFYDNFEGGASNWNFNEPSGINNEFYRSPVSSLAFVRAGNYTNNQVIEITSRQFNLSLFRDFPKKVYFTFWYNPVMDDPGDRVKLLFGKGTNWKTIIDVDGGEVSDYGLGYRKWHFIPVYIPLSFRGFDFQIKFRLETDYSDVDRGVFFDDLGIYLHNGYTNRYYYANGTSMATPFVTGAVALLWGKEPHLNATQVKNRILENVDILPQLAGKVKTSGRLNVAKVLGICIPPFSDIPCDHWAYNYIVWAKNRGITAGYPDGTFRPENSVKRSEMAAFIIRALEGEPQPGSYNSNPYFSDVPPNHWAFKYIQRIYERGIAQGYSTTPPTFGPDAPITREQMAKMLIRALISQGKEVEPPDDYCSSGAPFLDVQTDRWSCKYIKKVKELGITTGYPDGTYKPEASVTRAEMATFLYRTFKN